MNFKVELVTPALAKEWLEKNTNNRILNDVRVNDYIRDLKNGHWQLTHQGVAFYENGVLADGQHRLIAIAKSGISVEILVTRNMPLSTAHCHDRGKTR